MAIAEYFNNIKYKDLSPSFFLAYPPTTANEDKRDGRQPRLQKEDEKGGARGRILGEWRKKKKNPMHFTDIPSHIVFLTGKRHHPTGFLTLPSKFSLARLNFILL